MSITWLNSPAHIYRMCDNIWLTFTNQSTTTHTHTHPFNGPFPGLPGWAGTRKVKPIWILLKQETVSGSGISWAICKSATRSRQITTPAFHHSVFYRLDALPAAQQTASKHWRNNQSTTNTSKINVTNGYTVTWKRFLVSFGNRAERCRLAVSLCWSFTSSMPAPSSSFFSRQAYAAPSLLLSLVFLWPVVTWPPDCDLLSFL